MTSKVPLSKTTYVESLNLHPLREGCLTKNVNHKTFGHVGTGNYKVFFYISETRELISMFTGIHSIVERMI